MKNRLSHISLAVFILLTFSHGYNYSAKMPQKEHEAEVRLILVDVIVNKGGKFVTDLTKDDFEIYEDGQRVPIKSFELVSFRKSELETAETVDEKRSSQILENKLIVIFDGINTWQKDLIKSSQKIKDTLVSFASAGNELMVFQLSEQRGLEILQPFTSDEKLLSIAIDDAAGKEWLEGKESNQFLEMVEKEVREASQEVARETAKRKLGVVEKQLKSEFLITEKKKFEMTIGALFAALNVAKNISGRKSILLVSDGLPELYALHAPNPAFIRSQMDKTKPSEEILDALRPGTAVSGKVRVFDPFNLLEKKEFRNGEEAIEEIIKYANSHNISVYSFDPAPFARHLVTDTSAEYQSKVPLQEFLRQEKINKVQNLEFLSKETSGALIRGAKKYDSIRQVLSEDIASYYLLSFYPKRRNPDGKFHGIKIQVNRKGVDVKFRKGYTDYTEQEEDKIRLVSAFYNPSFYKELPFEAEFIPFYTDSGEFIPWMNIALPTKEFFIDRFSQYSKKTYTLSIWMKERQGEKLFGGYFNIPINVDESFLDSVEAIDNLRMSFKGPQLSFGQKDVQVIFALSDAKTKEIGTWDISFLPLGIKGDKESALLSCVLGNFVPFSNKKQEAFSISEEDGSLEFGLGKFFPNITDGFKQWNGISVFIQVYLPEGEKEIAADFSLLGKDGHIHDLEGELMVRSWTKKTKIWNGIYFLDISKGSLGENSLYVEISSPGTEFILNRALKLNILR